MYFAAGDVEATMADQPQPDKPPGKVEGKGKEPQKFLYLQLQQDRVSQAAGEQESGKWWYCYYSCLILLQDLHQA